MDFSYGSDTHVEPIRHTNFHVDRRRNRYEQQGSTSGPEDSNYSSFSDASKGETDTDDENTALTTQTLNTDGTPKRPMNAFMIFARRRRPQVSAENQSMRTGEISKILSKEWTSMQSREKQFYQEQAKQLKDTFNTRYPDYVYRRRPNNSRRKRKPDSGGPRPADRPVSFDLGDDFLGDVGESFTDENDPSIQHNVQNNFGDHGKLNSQPRSFSYPYPETNRPLHSNGAHEGNFLYCQDSRGPPLSASVVPPQLPHSLSYPYRSHSYSAQLFGPEYGQETYEAPVTRPVPWPMDAGHDRNHAVQKPHSISTSAKRLAWPRPTSITKPTINPAFSSTFVLPTLSSPFYPNPTSSESSVSSATSSPYANSASQSPFNSGIMLPSSSPKTDPNIYGYSSSSSCSPATSIASGLDAPSHPHSNTNQYFSQFHSPVHSSLHNSGMGAPQTYW